MADYQTDAQRRAPRTNIGMDLLCSSGRDEGTAMLVNLSSSGALLDPAALRPAVGNSVSIRFPTISKEEFPVLPTVVVRHAPGGFAVKFRAYLPIISRLISEYGVDD